MRGVEYAASVRGPAGRLSRQEFYSAVVGEGVQPQSSASVYSNYIRPGVERLLSRDTRIWLDAAFGRATGYIPAKPGGPVAIRGWFGEEAPNSKRFDVKTGEVEKWGRFHRSDVQSSRLGSGPAATTSGTLLQHPNPFPGVANLTVWGPSDCSDVIVRFSSNGDRRRVPSFCFPGNTLLRLEDGMTITMQALLHIHTSRASHLSTIRIASWDFAAQQVVYRHPDRFVLHPQADPVDMIRVAFGANTEGGAYLLDVTTTHEIFATRQGTDLWPTAGALEDGDQLLGLSGVRYPVRAAESVRRREALALFDLGFRDEPHNYFVSPDGIHWVLAHNKVL